MLFQKIIMPSLLIFLTGCSNNEHQTVPTTETISEKAKVGQPLLPPEFTAILWNVFEYELQADPTIAVIWQESTPSQNDYLIPIVQIALNQDTIFHPKITYHAHTAHLQFKWLGRTRNIHSYSNALFSPWGPAYVTHVHSQMKNGQIWFISEHSLPTIPHSTIVENISLKCTEHLLSYNYRITKCIDVSDIPDYDKDQDQEQEQTCENTTTVNTPFDLQVELNQLQKSIDTLTKTIDRLNLQHIRMTYQNTASQHIQNESPVSNMEDSTPTSVHQTQIEASASQHTTPLEMYVSSDFAQTGDVVQLFISSASEEIKVKVYQNTEKGTIPLRTLTNVKTISQTMPSEGWLGAKWTSSVDLPIPTTWDSDLYIIQAIDKNLKFNAAITVHNPNQEHDGILVLEPNLTRYAYNNWGGKSLYGYNSTDSLATETISSQRVNDGFQPESLKLDRWLNEHKHRVDYANMTVFDDDAFSLNPYKIILIVGHNEYWSRKSKERFEKFILGGGHALVLSGNTMWWETISHEDQHTVLKVVGDAQMDSLHFGMTDLHRILGVNFDNAGYITDFDNSMKNNGNGGFRIHDPEHWTMTNTNVKRSETIDSQYNIAGYEVDGADIQWTLENNQVTIQSIPSNINVLAYALSRRPNNEYGLGTVITYRPTKNSGCIFNAASIQWANGLWNLQDNIEVESASNKITNNVLNNFLSDIPKCVD